MQSKIAPSLMCADMMNLGGAVRELEAAGADYLHIDVMDGSFVPNLAIGTDLIRALKQIAHVPLDIHLMLTEPERKFDWFAFGPGDLVSIHYEATYHVQRTLQKIRDAGGRPLLALNPATPISALEQVACDIDGVLVMTVNPGYAGQRFIPQMRDKIAAIRKAWPELPIEIDGNVSFYNAADLRAAGADIFVGGSSSVFKPGDSPAGNINRLRELIG